MDKWERFRMILFQYKNDVRKSGGSEIQNISTFFSSSKRLQKAMKNELMTQQKDAHGLGASAFCG